MGCQGSHCPFLNRSDPRCSRHLSLDDLRHAFQYCFDEFEGCPTYLERLVERRVRQVRQSVEPVGGRFVELNVRVRDRRGVAVAAG